jgi:murein DD-endopeptidase MepM/ murein hydrolase activator NlpD
MKSKWIRITVLLVLMPMLAVLGSGVVGAQGGAFCVPTTGTVTKRYKPSPPYPPDQAHYGIDIASGANPGVTPVYAVYAGRVVYRGTMNMGHSLDVAVAKTMG